jgi:hypothetical protein
VHDDFSPNWSPVYFSDFMSHAREHGLDYVGEAVTAELHEALVAQGLEVSREEVDLGLVHLGRIGLLHE